jgi:hypothetical protein
MYVNFSYFITIQNVQIKQLLIKKKTNVTLFYFGNMFRRFNTPL